MYLYVRTRAEHITHVSYITRVSHTIHIHISSGSFTIYEDGTPAPPLLAFIRINSMIEGW